MSVDTRNGAWTIDTALQHVLSLIGANDHRYEQRFNDLDAAMNKGFERQKETVNVALQAADRAVTKAELAAEKRFESVNEFRNTLADQQRTLVSRTEVDALMHSFNDKVVGLEKVVDRLQAERQGIRGGYGYAVGVVGFVLTLATLIVMVLKFAKP